MAQSRELSNEAEQFKLSKERVDFYTTDKKITDSRNAITKLNNRLDKQNEISKKKAEESIPVILQILIQIRAALTSDPVTMQNDRMAATFEILENAITIFGETDRVQQKLGASEKLDYIGELIAKARPLGGCDTLLVTPADKKKPLDKQAAAALPLKSNAAFIRYGDQLYYINKDWHKFSLINLSKKWLTEFDKLVTPQENVKALPPEIMGEIERITGLTHFGLSPFRHLHDLVQRVSELTMTKDTVALWEEASTWLEGLYRKTADPIKGRDPVTKEPMRGDDGMYPLSDMVEDRTLRWKFGITKMEVSIHYHRASKKVDALTEAFKLNPDKPQQIPPMLRASQPALPVKPASGSMSQIMQLLPQAQAMEPIENNNVEGSIICQMEVLPDTHDGFIPLVFYIPKEQAEYGQTVSDMVRDCFANPLVRSLREQRISNTDVDLLISHFEVLIIKFGLTGMQKSMLANFQEDALSELKKYLDGLSWYNPLRLFGRGDGTSMLDKVNAQAALAAFNDIQGGDKVSEQILRLIKLRRQVHETDSKTLWPCITKLLMNVIERVCPIATHPELERRSSIPDLSRGGKLSK